MNKIELIIRKDEKGFRARLYISFACTEKYSSDTLEGLLETIDKRIKGLLEK